MKRLLLKWWGINNAWYGVFIISKKESWDYYCHGRRLATGSSAARDGGKVAVKKLKEAIASNKFTWHEDNIYTLKGYRMGQLISSDSPGRLTHSYFEEYALKARII